MNPERVAVDVNSTDLDALVDLSRKQAVTSALVQELKDYSAQFYFTQPAEAVRIAQVAYELGLQLPMPAPALGRWALANAFLHASRYLDAASLFEQARNDYVAAGYQLDAARMGVGHVGVLAYMGQGKMGLALAKKIEPILAKSAKTNPADLRRLGNLLMNLGVLHELLGQYEEALLLYDRQIHLALQLNDRHMLARSKHNQAYAFVQIAAFDRALAIYQEAEALCLEIDAKTDLVRLYINLADLFASLRRYPDAKWAQEQAERYLGVGMDQESYRLTLFRAHLYLQSNLPIPETMIVGLQRAQLAFAAHGPLQEECLAWLLLARCHAKLGERTLARRTFEKARELVVADANRALEYRVLHGLSQIEQTEQNYAGAIRHYEAAIQQIEAIRYELYSETLRSGFLSDKLEVYADLAALYIQLGQLDDAFEVVERAKSRLVTEKLAFRLGAEAKRATGSEDPQIAAWARRLNRTLHQLERLYAQAKLESRHDGEQSTASVEHTQRTIKSLENEVQAIVEQMQRRRPLLSILTTGHSASLVQIRENLHQSFFLQYHILNDHYYAFVVNDSAILGHVPLAKVADVEQARRAFTLAVEQTLEISLRLEPTKAERYLTSLVDNVNRQLQTLYKLLFQPLLAYLPADAPLVISPAGSLYYVPFHALFDGQQHLVEQRVISYTPSATVLNLCTQKTAKGQGVLLFGYADQQLPAIEAELATLAQLFPAAELCTGRQAKTKRFMNKVQQHRFVHVATHATFRTDNPMLSSLSFADRRLTLAEIAQLRLEADLVVLSGCETGKGQLQGSDLLSLASGFLGAGARSLLVSLWRVEDTTTAQLMEHFYRAMLAGEQPAVALQTAQRWLLNEGRASTGQRSFYRHPAYWAPFMLVGNWRSPS